MTASTLQCTTGTNAAEMTRAATRDYAELNKRLKARYLNFKCNQDYHNVRKPLEADEKYARVRYLDPSNSKSPKQRRYNPNILQELDKCYQKK